MCDLPFFPLDTPLPPLCDECKAAIAAKREQEAVVVASEPDLVGWAMIHGLPRVEHASGWRWESRHQEERDIYGR